LSAKARAMAAPATPAPTTKQWRGALTV